MKVLRFVAAFAAFAGIQGAVPVQAVVNMISVEHRVWGDAGEFPTYSYHEASPVPLSGNISGFSTIYVGDPVLNCASSSASDWSVDAYRIGNASHANAYAQNTYVFKPFARELSISLNGMIGEWWFENTAKMTLTDLSTGSLISIFQSPRDPREVSPPDATIYYPYPFSWNATVEVNPEHQYELILFVSAHRGEGGDGSASLTLTPIPEPGTTLLACMAALLVCGRRRR
jgi:hypothetical protein